MRLSHLIYAKISIYTHQKNPQYKSLVKTLKECVSTSSINKIKQTNNL